MVQKRTTTQQRMSKATARKVSGRAGKLVRKHNDPQPHRDNQDVPRATTDLQRNRYK
tara:strand:+ start:429 stop:599 length:171 start_codon:yes stop_codon:yes gene_type:complete